MHPEFFHGSLKFYQSEDAFRLGTDAMVLADFARIPPGAAVCDLCAGTGAVGLLLLARDRSLSVTAVELQEASCATMRRSVAENGLGDRLTVLCADLREHRTALPHGGFRHVVCNPPYDPVSAGAAPENPAAAIARTEVCCTLTDVLTALRAAGLEPKRLRLVRHRADKQPSLVLIRAVLGGRPGLAVEPDCVLYEADGAPSADYRRIYHLQERNESCPESST